jgi:hypothetical protein
MIVRPHSGVLLPQWSMGTHLKLEQKRALMEDFSTGALRSGRARNLLQTRGVKGK